jgi:hypothetical protein
VIHLTNELWSDKLSQVRNRYRVFGAALTLGEFTVANLARLSGVKETSVRTILRRDLGVFLENHGQKPSGKKGGSSTVYSLKPQAVVNLQSQLEAMYMEARRLAPGAEEGSAAPSGPEALAALLAAESLLERARGTSDAAARRFYRESASGAIRSAQVELEATNPYGLRNESWDHLRHQLVKLWGLTPNSPVTKIPSFEPALSPVTMPRSYFGPGASALMPRGLKLSLSSALAKARARGAEVKIRIEPGGRTRTAVGFEPPLPAYSVVFDRERNKYTEVASVKRSAQSSFQLAMSKLVKVSWHQQKGIVAASSNRDVEALTFQECAVVAKGVRGIEEMVSKSGYGRPRGYVLLVNPKSGKQERNRAVEGCFKNHE